MTFNIFELMSVAKSKSDTRVVVQFRINEEDKIAWRKRANDLGISLSRYIKTVVQKDVNRNKSTKDKSA